MYKRFRKETIQPEGGLTRRLRISFYNIRRCGNRFSLDVTVPTDKKIKKGVIFITVADLFRNNNIFSYPPISEDYDIFTGNAVKGYFICAMEDYFSEYEASFDCDSINYFREEFYFSDFVGFFESLVICLEKYSPEQAEAKFYLFNSLKG